MTTSQDTFANLTDDELTSLYRTIKSGRDKIWRAVGRAWIDPSQYHAVSELSAILGELHVINQAR